MIKKLKKWVLLAEDDTELLDLYESFLEMHFGEDVKIIKAEDGLEATNKLPFQAFDLIITDLNMPKKTGFAFIQAVKESQMNEHTPILVITGEDSQNIDKQKMTVLLKPLDQTQFISTVANQLKLGKTDQRVAADLLNNFIDSGLNLLEKVAGLEATQLGPTPKREGEDIEGDFMELITIRVGKLKNSFLFTFEGEVVKRLGQKSRASSSQQPNDSDLQKIVQIAGEMIVRFSLKKFEGKSMQILHSHHVERDSSDHKKIKRKKGLKIPVRTPLGMMNIYGLMQY